MNFLKIFGTFLFVCFFWFFLMRRKNFVEVDKNTGEKMFAKYLSADGCFVKAIILLTVMIKTCYMVPDTMAFAFTRQPMKRNFTWSNRAIHLRSSTAFLSRLKFWFAKKLKMNLRIAPTDTSFCKYRDHAKILIVFKRWCNCLILCEIIFQLEILRD